MPIRTDCVRPAHFFSTLAITLQRSITGVAINNEKVARPIGIKPINRDTHQINGRHRPLHIHMPAPIIPRSKRAQHQQNYVGTRLSSVSSKREWHKLHMNNTTRRAKIGDGSARCPHPRNDRLAHGRVGRLHLYAGRIRAVDGPQRRRIRNCNDRTRLWKYRIGAVIRTGKTKSSLELLAERRVRQKIDRLRPPQPVRTRDSTRMAAVLRGRLKTDQ